MGLFIFFGCSSPSGSSDDGNPITVVAPEYRGTFKYGVNLYVITETTCTYAGTYTAWTRGNELWVLEPGNIKGKWGPFSDVNTLVVNGKNYIRQ